MAKVDGVRRNTPTCSERWAKIATFDFMLLSVAHSIPFHQFARAAPIDTTTDEPPPALAQVSRLDVGLIREDAPEHHQAERANMHLREDLNHAEATVSLRERHLALDACGRIIQPSAADRQDRLRTVPNNSEHRL